MISFLDNLIIGAPKEMIFLVEIGFMIILAAFFAFIIRLIKQPLIPAYVIAGVVIGPLFLGLVKDPVLIDALSQIGIAFLIFTAGL
jgi:Kef-type K+ transport system membrane component KefB